MSKITKNLASKIAKIDLKLHNTKLKSERDYLLAVRECLLNYKCGTGSDKAELKKFNNYFKKEMIKIGNKFKRDFKSEAEHYLKKALIQYEEGMEDAGLFSAPKLAKFRSKTLESLKAEFKRRLDNYTKSLQLGDTLANISDFAASVHDATVDVIKDNVGDKAINSIKLTKQDLKALEKVKKEFETLYAKEFIKNKRKGIRGINFGGKSLKAEQFELDINEPQRLLDSSISAAIDNLNSSVTREGIKAVNRAYMEAEPEERNLTQITTIAAKDLGKAPSQVKSFVNTTMSIARENSRDFLEDGYKDSIAGWEFDAHLDKRTTKGCQQREGVKYMKKNPDATKRETVPADSLVPRHYNCRSMLIPIPYKDGEEWVLVEDIQYQEGDDLLRKRKWIKEIK